MINVICPYCGKETSSQTKIFGDCTMEIFGVGDKVDSDDFSGIYELKNNCSCGNNIRILIRNGIIEKATKDDPDYRELLFGATTKVIK